MGLPLRVANSATATMAPSRATPSRMRPRGQWRGHGPYQASARGTTTNAPVASPRTHVRQTVGRSWRSITFPERSDVAPAVALTAAPAAIATTIAPTPRTLSSGDPRRTNRRNSTIARITSSMFPQVWPSAEPIGSAM